MGCGGRWSVRAWSAAARASVRVAGCRAVVMATVVESSQAFSALVKRMSRASLEYVVFEALLNEAAETGALERVLTDAAQRLERLERELGARGPQGRPGAT